MASKYLKGITVEIGGNVSPLNDALKDVDRQSNILQNELREVEKLLKLDPTNTELLAQKQKLLGDAVANSKERLEKLKSAQEQFIASGGDVSSEAYLALQREIIKTEQELEKTSGQAWETGNQFEKAGEKAEDSGEKAQKGSGGWSKLGGVLKSAGALAAKVVAALGAAAAGAAAGLASMATNAAQNADDINTLSKQSGLSVEEIQKFQFATEQIDVSMDTLTGSMAKLTKNMATASKGTGDAYNAFKALGIEITNQDGTLRDRNEVFNEAINALGEMENETQRDAYAMQIFGKSAQDLNPLILGGADALKELGDQAEAAGVILDQDALDSLNTLTDATDTFKATLSGAGNLFSTELAEPMAGVVNEVTGYIQDITQSFEKGGLSGVSEQIGKILSEIVNKITQNLPKIINAGMRIIQSLADGIAQNLPIIVQAAVSILIMLTTSLIDMLPQLLSMGMTLLVELATGIAQALPELIPQAVGIILTLVENLLDNIDQLIDAALQLIMGLADGIIAALPVLIEKAPVIIQKLVDALVNNLPKLLEAAYRIMIALVQGILDNLPELFNAAFQIIGSLVSGIFKFIGNLVPAAINIVSNIWDTIVNTDWLQLGKDIINGIVDGVVDAALGLVNAVKDAVSSAISAAKSLFGWEDDSDLPDETGASGRKTSGTRSGYTGGTTNITINNHSPRALTEAESAKQTKRALRDLALEAY